MSNRIDAGRLQPLLLGVAIVAALLAAVALVLSGRALQQQAQLREHMASLTAIAQNIPLQAGAAVRGSAPAFDARAKPRAHQTPGPSRAPRRPPAVECSARWP